MSISVGDAIVYFKGDTTGVDQSITQMTGNATVAGDNMRRAFNFGAVVAGFQVLGQGINAVVAEANESERSFANLQAAVTATGGASGYTATQLSAMAGELSALTAIDDEAIQDGQAMLVTFKNIGQDVFPLATRAMLDMATAMSGGTQPSAEALRGTSIQLGKALNDPIAGISALSRVGVSFTEQQKAQIKTMVESGNVMGAQKIILAELTSEFGGVAAARMQTFQGRADALKISMGNLAATIGGPLQALTPFLAAAPGATMVFNGLKTGVMAAAASFGFFSSGAASAAAAVPAVASAATAASAAVGTAGMGGAAVAATAAIAGPGALIAAAAAAVVALGLMAKAAWDAGTAKAELARVEERYPAQVEQLIGVLEKEGITYDKVKMASMSLGQQIDYLNRLYGSHVQSNAQTAQSVENLKYAYEDVTRSVEFSMITLGQQLQNGEITQAQFAEQSEIQASRSAAAWAKYVEAFNSAIAIDAASGNWFAQLLQAGVAANPPQQPGTVPAFASGTDSAPGGWSLVGERGPEIVNLPKGSQVFDNKTSAAMLSGAGGITVQGPLISGVTLAGDMDVDRLATRMYDKLQEKLARKGVR